jgi:hypothetical protein
VLRLGLEEERARRKEEMRMVVGTEVQDRAIRLRGFNSFRMDDSGDCERVGREMKMHEGRKEMV